MINKVTLIGRLGKDPEVRSLEGGAMVARFSLATSESYKDKNEQWVEQTEWHNIVVWRDLAKRAADQLKKGMLVYLEGKITYRAWKDNEGKDQKITEIVAGHYRILTKPEYMQHTAEVTFNTASNDHTPVGEGGDLPF